MVGSDGEGDDVGAGQADQAVASSTRRSLYTSISNQMVYKPSLKRELEWGLDCTPFRSVWQDAHA
jgi:hypothetical protein